jgi:hypothetical protein
MDYGVCDFNAHWCSVAVSTYWDNWRWPSRAETCCVLSESGRKKILYCITDGLWYTFTIYHPENQHFLPVEIYFVVISICWTVTYGHMCKISCVCSFVMFVLTPADGLWCVLFIYLALRWFWCPEIGTTSADLAQMRRFYPRKEKRVQSPKCLRV